MDDKKINDSNSTIGHRLRMARLFCNLTPEELSQQSGIPVERINECEAGTGQITTDEIAAIAVILRILFYTGKSTSS